MTTDDFAAWVDRRRLPSRLSQDQLRQLQAYMTVLSEWNSRLNLTGFSLSSDLDRALDRLVLEPVLAAGHINTAVRRLVDVGSGSGSPAIPLLIAAPWLDLTMVESRQKKSVFLREAVRAVGLAATVVTSRLEDLATGSPIVRFDAASLRGVRLDSALALALGTLLPPGAPLLYFGSTDGIAPELNGFENVNPTTFETLPGFQLNTLTRS